MEASEFMKLAAELKLEDVPPGGQGLQGSARDISRFLHAGDPNVDHLFLGVYGAMMATGLERIEINLGDEAIPDKVMDGTRVRLVISKDRLVLERLPEPEGDEPSTPSANVEALSDGGGHD